METKPELKSGTRLLLRGGEVAELCGWSRAKAYELMASGELPVVRCGRNVRVPYEGLLEWVRRSTEGGEVATPMGASE